MMKEVKKDDQGKIVSFKISAQGISMPYVQALLSYLHRNLDCVKEIRIRDVPGKNGGETCQQIAVRIENNLGQSWLSVGLIERLIHPTDKLQWRISGGYTFLMAAKTFQSGGKTIKAEQILRQYFEDIEALSEPDEELLRIGLVYKKPCFHGFELTVTRTSGYNPKQIPAAFSTNSERYLTAKDRQAIRGKRASVSKKAAGGRPA
jgi:hypothetical protein